MPALCPTCAKPLPPRTRARFCPICALRGALELPEEDIQADEPGQALGEYDLLEPIGRGGMGVVYRARQRRLGRLVAVKVLAAGAFASETARRRFQAEAQAAARLRHPHIVTVHEIGEQAGQPFYSMELVEGSTLAELTQGGARPAREAATLVRTVAEAVHYAHEQGVLHRDLKPSNILLNSAGSPLVGDFGLARRLDTEERLTLTGDVFGSPAYLAPEQARGDREREGVTSDVYALGAILFQLLCARPPFLGDSPQSVLRQVAEEEPLAPRRLNPGIPADLETICLKCLEKDPVRRYASARALAEDLGRFLNLEPVQARPVGPLGRAARWSRRHPARAGLLGALVLLLLVVVIVPSLALLRVRRAERARELQLHETLLSQARALRLGGQSGRRVGSLTALQQAASLAAISAHAFGTSSLRREAIASLALDDARLIAAPELPAEPDATYLGLDPTGEFVAHASFRGPVRWFNRRDGSERGRLDLGGRTLQHLLEFSPNGRFLAIRHGSEIAVWDLTNRAVAIAQPSWLNRYSFRPDSAAVAFLHPDGRVVGHALPDGRELWRWTEPMTNARGALAFSPDGRKLALGLGGSRGVQIRDAESGELHQSFRFPDPVTVVAWSRSGHWLAAGGDGGQVRLWETLPSEAGPGAQGSGWNFEAHADSVRALAFTRDERQLLSAGAEESVRVIDVRTGRPGLQLQGVAFQFHFTADGLAGPVWQGGRPAWLALTNSDCFSAWRAEAGTGSALGASLDPTGRHLAATREKEIRVWELPSLRPVARLACERATAVYFTPDGHLLAAGWNQATRWPGRLDADGRLEFGPAQTVLAGLGGESAAFPASGEPVVLADYLRNCARLITKEGQPIREFRHDRIASVSLSPDGRWLGTGSIDRDPLRVWDTETGQMLREWPGEGDFRLAFSPDGKWLAQYGLKVRLWQTGSWSPGPGLPTTPANTALGGAAFSPDGEILAFSAADREIHLLQLSTMTLQATLEAPHPLRINRMAFSADGTHLVAATTQGEVQVWKLPALREHLRQLGL